MANVCHRALEREKGCHRALEGEMDEADETVRKLTKKRVSSYRDFNRRDRLIVKTN